MFAKRTTRSKHGVWLTLGRGLPDGCVDPGLQEVDGGESHSSKPVQYTTLHWKPNMVNPVSHFNAPKCSSLHSMLKVQGWTENIAMSNKIMPHLPTGKELCDMSAAVVACN